MIWLASEPSPLLFLSPQDSLGVCKWLRGNTTGQISWTNQRHNLTTQSLAQQCNSKRGGLGVLAVLLRSSRVIFLLKGDAEGLPLHDLFCFFLFSSSSTSSSLNKQILSWLTSFLAFTLPFLFPHSTRVKRGKWAVWCLAAYSQQWARSCREKWLRTLLRTSWKNSKWI